MAIECEHFYSRDSEKDRECSDCRSERGLVPDCDNPRCEAKENPVTLDEYKTALEHWRSHRLHYGCSHGK